MVVKKQGDKWCVIHCTGPDKGKPIKCFNTKKEAEAMHRAIQASKNNAIDDAYAQIGKTSLLEAMIIVTKDAGVNSGYMVGGVVERGWTEHDIDLIGVKDANLPRICHRLKEDTPHGPSIPLSRVAAFLDAVASGKKWDVKWHMKPKKTARTSHEYYDINELKNLPEGKYIVEPKYDGIFVRAAKIGSVVSIVTDEGNEISKKIQPISDELKKVSTESFALECELVAVKDGDRMDHTAVTRALRSSAEQDYDLLLAPYDIIMIDGEDIKDKPLDERKKTLSIIKKSEKIQPIPYIESDDLIEAAIKIASREGVVVKKLDSKYSQSGAEWYKWKKQAVIDVKVEGIEKTGTGRFVYTCSVGGEVIGKTYSTDIEAKEGDIIEVSVDHITKRGERYTWYAPKVTRKRSDKSKSDPLSLLEKMLPIDSEDEKEEPEEEDLPLGSGRFVLHEHWWGAAHHFDLRFEKTNEDDQKTMVGFTLLAGSEDELKKKLSEGKILAKEKGYHDAKWLDFSGEIEPGEPGNPSKNYTAHMEVRDKGTYEFIRRTTDFAEVEISGKILKGTYFIRKVEFKESRPEGSEEGKEGQDDWVFWEKESKVDAAYNFNRKRKNGASKPEMHN